MTKTIKFITFGILLFPIIVLGQKTGKFEIDTARILKNENLEGFVQSLKSSNFESFTDKKAIPTFIKKQLNNLANGFSIANPNQPYQCCCTSPRRLPERQLTFLAKSKDILVMTYKTGGFGVSTHLLFIRFDTNKIIDLWTGYGATDLNSLNDIISYIEESRHKKQKLNTNVIIL